MNISSRWNSLQWNLLAAGLVVITLLISCTDKQLALGHDSIQTIQGNRPCHANTTPATAASH